MTQPVRYRLDDGDDPEAAERGLAALVLREHSGLEPEDLNIDLGPPGTLLPEA